MIAPFQVLRGSLLGIQAEPRGRRGLIVAEHPALGAFPRSIANALASGRAQAVQAAVKVHRAGAGSADHSEAQEELGQTLRHKDDAAMRVNQRGGIGDSPFEGEPALDPPRRGKAG